MNLDQARFFMVEQQIRPWDILDPKILDLYMETPRHEFVPEEQASLAYMDIELPIAHNQTMLRPNVEARMLQAADIQGDETVLEIGTGTGFMTALISKLAKQVTTVEIHKDLQAEAKSNLNGYDNITFELGDASQGWETDDTLYDNILLTGSLPKILENYKQKLTLGGRLVGVFGEGSVMEAQLITRTSDAEWEIESLFETVLAPLENVDIKPHFSL